MTNGPPEPVGLRLVAYPVVAAPMAVLLGVGGNVSGTGPPR
ncbi:hypothetical protein AB0B66_22585 [Catellatospora sp. NPDC049111]